jgi:hypothetical protein
MSIRRSGESRIEHEAPTSQEDDFEKRSGTIE